MLNNAWEFLIRQDDANERTEGHEAEFGIGSAQGTAGVAGQIVPKPARKLSLE
jgi:hypothetical protein